MVPGTGSPVKGHILRTHQGQEFPEPHPFIQHCLTTSWMDSAGFWYRKKSKTRIPALENSYFRVQNRKREPRHGPVRRRPAVARKGQTGGLCLSSSLNSGFGQHLALVRFENMMRRTRLLLLMVLSAGLFVTFTNWGKTVNVIIQNT